MTGGGQDQSAEAFIVHLSTCPDCPTVVERMQVDSPVIKALQRQSTIQLPAVKYEALAEKLSKISWHTGRLSVDKVQSAPLPNVPIPDRLGPYLLQDILGVGGMGMVYRAKDTVLERMVAIKLLRHDRVQNSQDRDRFLREARAMAAVKHDHIVAIFQVGQTETQGTEPISFLAMELLEGESLFDWIKQVPQTPLAWVVRIGRQAASGLAAAHAKGLIHRDVKPANLFLEAPAGWRSKLDHQRPPLAEVARVKLLDFGLAQPAEGEIREEEALFGTAGYMAPEQARGEALDGRGDLFGLGCVLYELCTGSHPFKNRTGCTLEPLVPIRERNPDVLPALAALIERMLADDPADRPDSASWVERELAVLEADISQLDTRTLRAAATIANSIAVPVTARRKHRRNVALLAGMFVASIGISLFLGRLFNGKSEIAVAPENRHGELSRPEVSSVNNPGPIVVPLDAEWFSRVRELPLDDQASQVLSKLRELNPGFDGEAQKVVIDNGAVTELHIFTDGVHDIRPVKALHDMKRFVAVGSAPGAGKLTDISPLAGLDLTGLILHGNPELKDFEVVKSMRGLIQLDAGDTKIGSLDDLPPTLTDLTISRSPVRDLTPLRKMTKLERFNCLGCSVASFEPLAGLPIAALDCDYLPDRDEPVFRRMAHLHSVNNLPVQTILREYAPMPWHLVSTQWDIGQETPFKSLAVDVTISDKVPYSVKLYIAPISSSLSQTSFFGGLQTQADGYTKSDPTFREIGPGFLFSMWGERSEEAIRPADGGIFRSDRDNNDDYVSVRRPFEWKKGKYTYRLSVMDQEMVKDKAYTWVGAFMYAHEKNENLFIGALRFKGDKLVLDREVRNFVAVYGERRPVTDIPKVTVTFGPPVVNGTTVKNPTAEAVYLKGVPDYADAVAKDGSVVITVGTPIEGREKRRITLIEGKK